MAELASKSNTKSVVWDSLSLEVGADGKPVHKSIHGRKGQATSLQSYTWTTNEQPINTSGIDGDAGSV